MKAKEEEKLEKKVETNEKKSCKKIVIIALVIVLFLGIGVFSFLCIPRISLKGSSREVIKLNDVYKEKGAVAKIVIKDISDKVKVVGNVDVTKPGKYELKYSVKEGFITQSVTRVVEVIDDIYPVIELKGKSKATVCPNYDYEEEGYTATDNYDGDITEEVVVLKKDNLISYTVEDSSKNQTIVTREIIKEDKEKPSISLNGPSVKYVMLNSKYTEQGAKAEDNCDGDITSKIKKEGSVNTSKTGTYTIKYAITDSSDNTASISRKVIVYDRASDISGVATKNTIYLTFDDGPSSSITPKVLDILKEKGVKATFFVINKSNSLDYLIKREYNEGHTVALHSYTHNYKTIYSSTTAYFDDLQKISNKVKSLIGEESKIIRFPGGGSNTVSKNYSKGIMTYLTNEVINRGYHYFDWNVSSGDAGGANSASQVYKNVTSNLSSSRANIVLMHDFENNYKTLNALSDIIDYGLAKGFIFKAIDMTTPLVRHKVNN